jgi:hypothetical protein
MSNRISITDRAARRNAWRSSGDDWSLWTVGTMPPKMGKFHRRKAGAHTHGGAHRPFEFSIISVHRRLYAHDRAQAEKFNASLAALAVNPPTVLVTAI